MDDILLNQHSHGEMEIQDIELCKKVANILLDHYAGHVWHVQASHEAGTVDIKLNYPDKLGLLPKWGFKLHINKITPHKVMQAGGEILERYRLARSRATQYAVIDAINNGIDNSGAIR